MEIEKCTNFTYYLIQAVPILGFRDPSLSLSSDHRRWDSLSALDEERSFFVWGGDIFSAQHLEQQQEFKRRYQAVQQSR